jgi:hypothetical protein
MPEEFAPAVPRQVPAGVRYRGIRSIRGLPPRLLPIRNRRGELAEVAFAHALVRRIIDPPVRLDLIDVGLAGLR